MKPLRLNARAPRPGNDNRVTLPDVAYLILFAAMLGCLAAMGLLIGGMLP